MFGLYVQNFLFGGIVWLATVVSYGRCVTISALSLVFCVSLLFLLPLLSLALTCILAWAVASLTSRMDAVRKQFSLPDELKPFAVIAVGYPRREDANHPVDRFDPERIHLETL